MAGIIITNEQYRQGFMLEEYQGVYSLVAAKQGKDGKEYKEWAYREDRHKNEETNTWESAPGKKLPLKIELGSRREAADRLIEILGMLGVKVKEEKSNAGDEDDGSVPF